MCDKTLEMLCPSSSTDLRKCMSLMITQATNKHTNLNYNEYSTVVWIKLWTIMMEGWYIDTPFYENSHHVESNSFKLSQFMI